MPTKALEGSIDELYEEIVYLIDRRGKPICIAKVPVASQRVELANMLKEHKDNLGRFDFTVTLDNVAGTMTVVPNQDLVKTLLQGWDEVMRACRRAPLFRI